MCHTYCDTYEHAHACVCMCGRQCYMVFYFEVTMREPVDRNEAADAEVGGRVELRAAATLLAAHTHTLSVVA